MIHRLYNIKNMESRQFERREWANEERQQISPFGMEIKMALIRRNMDAKELAQRINKTKATVSDIIYGRNKCEKRLS